ncbi:MAG: ribonuclease P protein component [Bacteroidetes bacterium]|nr:ribonuclease P protein component [Bacteroidota bacterium]
MNKEDIALNNKPQLKKVPLEGDLGGFSPPLVGEAGRGLAFLKSHRIHSEKEREELFAQGSSHIEFPFKFVWSFVPADCFSSKLLVSVPKKRVRHAVDRNFVKRRIRETFRLFENEISVQAPCGELRVAVIFMSDKHEQCKSCNGQLVKGLRKVFQISNKNP